MTAFLFIVAIGITLGGKILDGGTKTLKVLGFVFILMGLFQGMDLLDQRPNLAEGSLYTLASDIQHLESRVKYSEADIMQMAEPSMSRQQFLDSIPTLFSDENVKQWQDNVPLIAHDFLDSKAILTMLQIIIGFLLLRFASQNKVLEELRQHLKVEAA